VYPNTPKFRIFRCVGEFCEGSGRKIGEVYYKTSMTRRQVDYIATATQLSWDDLYFGREGWKVADGGEYKCGYRKLKRITNRGRCQQAWWDEAFADANVRVLEDEDRSVDEESREGEGAEGDATAAESERNAQEGNLAAE